MHVWVQHARVAADSWRRVVEGGVLVVACAGAYRLARWAVCRTPPVPLLGFDVQSRVVHPSDPRVRRTRWVPMAAVRGWTDLRGWPKGTRCFLPAGDWDRERVVGFDGYRRGSRNYRSALEIFADGRPYTETEQYAHLMGLMASGEWHPELTMRGGTEASVHTYFAWLESVFRAIERDGYRTQRDLTGRRALEHEVRMMVDRDGRLVRALGGNHRFAMAQVLGLEAIPVDVFAVHREWARAQHRRRGGSLVHAIAEGLDALSLAA